MLVFGRTFVRRGTDASMLGGGQKEKVLVGRLPDRPARYGLKSAPRRSNPGRFVALSILLIGGMADSLTMIHAATRAWWEGEKSDSQSLS